MEERTVKKKKTASSKKKTSSSASKKKSGTKKKTSGTLRLTKEEKTLIENYRKCSTVEKEVIRAIAEKAGSSDAGSLLGLLGK